MKQFLIDLIKSTGPISVSQLIEESLFHPNLGYYNKNQPFGAKGDFVTSPEISQVFGELIAIYFLHIFQSHYQNKEISFIEIGAGRGLLMKDVLKTFKKFNFFPKVFIIEKSSNLAKAQQENLEEFKIKWLKDFSEFKKQNKNPVFFIANELFDCLPINQFVRAKDRWQEIMVSLENNNLKFALSPNIIAIRRGEENIPEDAILEVSLATKALMVEISAEIEHIGGLGVIIDYGYIKNPLTSTLQAVKNHKKCDILENIGNCDISSLVNFKLLENIAKKNKLQTSLISQRKFLLDLGIQQRLDNIKENKDKIKLEVERLINKKQMGELFKVLIFWK